MTVTAAQPGIAELLAMTGARPAGVRRFDCPQCGGRRTIAVDEGRGLFCCHHAGCTFAGNAGTLRRRLGMQRGWLPRAEYLRQKREQERTHTAAERLAAAVHVRRMNLVKALADLAEIERLAHRVGADTDAVWEALEAVYRERPTILTELAILESSSIAAVIQVLSCEPDARQDALDSVLCAGGLYEPAGKFVELCL